MNKFDPDWTMRPGVFLREMMDDSGLKGDMGVRMVAKLAGLDPIIIGGILDGSVEITEDIARHLAAGAQPLAISEQFWLNVEGVYRAGLKAGKIDVSSQYDEDYVTVTVAEPREHLAWLMWCFEQGFDDPANDHPDDARLRAHLLEMADEVLALMARADGNRPHPAIEPVSHQPGRTHMAQTDTINLAWFDPDSPDLNYWAPALAALDDPDVSGIEAAKRFSFDRLFDVAETAIAARWPHAQVYRYCGGKGDGHFNGRGIRFAEPEGWGEFAADLICDPASWPSDEAVLAVYHAALGD